MTANAKKIVRKARGGGRWFPGTQRELQTMVSGCISNAEIPKVEGRIVGAIAPHAGYVYSGKVAGYTFRALRDNAVGANMPETVVVLGFSHSMGFPGVALMDGDALSTPLGEAKLDKEAAEALMAGRPGIGFNYAPHAGEHSAENEIPFIQSALPDAKLVVAIIGDHDAKTLQDLVAGLNDLAKKRHILVVASSDMLHDPDYDLVTRTDKGTLEKVKSMDYSGLLKSWDYSSQVFCGIAPVLAVMRFAQSQGCREGTVLRYRNSGDDFPESRGQWVVGYGAVVFAAPGGN
jgi:MEMO1 family protein